MRRDQQVGQRLSQQRVVRGGWLHRQHIQAGARQAAAAQRIRQRPLVDEPDRLSRLRDRGVCLLENGEVVLGVEVRADRVQEADGALSNSLAKLRSFLAE